MTRTGNETLSVEIDGQRGLPRDLDSCEALAGERLPRAIFDYYAGGAAEEAALRTNRSAFDRWWLRPRVLVDVSAIDTRVRLLGDDVAFPVLLAPAAFQCLAHPEGERASTRAAHTLGTIPVLSTLATTAIEDVAAASAGPLWFQLYVLRDRALTRDLVLRARDAGCRALCITVDVPVQGNRTRDARNQFHLPPEVEIANFRGMPQHALPLTAGSGLDRFIAREFDPTLTWSFLDWLAGVSDLPVVVKGVLTAEDASLCVDRGAAGIIVSNHGGRQLGCAPPTLAVLPEVAAAVAGRLPVLLDGGVRRGSDVVKARALGADAVLIGRPYLWGLSLAGEPGVRHVLEVLRAEIARTLALIGVPRFADVGAGAVMPAT